jgi:hypothetical protein
LHRGTHGQYGKDYGNDGQDEPNWVPEQRKDYADDRYGRVADLVNFSQPSAA